MLRSALANAFSLLCELCTFCKSTVRVCVQMPRACCGSPTHLLFPLLSSLMLPAASPSAYFLPRATSPVFQWVCFSAALLHTSVCHGELRVSSPSPSPTLTHSPAPASSPDRALFAGGVWKNTEDEILKAAVMKYGAFTFSPRLLASRQTRHACTQVRCRVVCCNLTSVCQFACSWHCVSLGQPLHGSLGHGVTLDGHDVLVGAHTLQWLATTVS
jgi:hypothetical protein